MLNFLLGETKYISMQVTSKINELVVVSEATYKIINSLGELVESGNCEIRNSNCLYVLYTPTAKGAYKVEIAYTVEPEKRIVGCSLNVN